VNGQAVPAGYNAVQAISAMNTAAAGGKKEKRQENRYNRNAAKRSALTGGAVTVENIRRGDAIMGQEANRLLTMLFGDARINGWPMPKNDREADRLLDRTGYFDPMGGNIDDRNKRAIEEWLRLYPPAPGSTYP